MDYNAAWREWLKFGLDINKCTCNECDKKDKCPYAWDVYNADGDCLGQK